MGQLEKYGLYVLCLVIFLILGVTIWGEPDGARLNNPGAAAAMNATGDPAAPRPAAAPTADNRGAVDASFGGGRGNTLASLLQPPEDFGKQPAADKRSSGPGTTPNGPAQEVANVEPKSEPAPASQTAATRSYRIKKGDTFEGIALRELGSRVRRQEIERLNPGVDAAKLQIGQEIRLPTGAAPAAGGASSDKATAVAPPMTGGEALQRAGAFRTYKIGKGDTLDRIARLELGSSTRVDDIKQLNPGLDPRKLQVGQSIKLPIR